MASPRVTVSYENTPQPQQKTYERVYPHGIGAAIIEPLRARGLEVNEARFTDPENGLSEAVLASTDVLFHWAHRSKHLITDETVLRIRKHVVVDGMGLVLLHSGITGKIFQTLIGTTGSFIFRNVGERERVWVIDRAHPIAHDLPSSFELEDEEMYGEEFDIPTPDDLIFISWWEGGEVMRSGCSWRRGRGQVFFFRGGHETAPTFHNPAVQQMMFNAAHWLAPNPDTLPVRHAAAKEPPEARFNDRIAKAAAAWTPLPLSKRF